MNKALIIFFSSLAIAQSAVLAQPGAGNIVIDPSKILLDNNIPSPDMNNKDKVIVVNPSMLFLENNILPGDTETRDKFNQFKKTAGKTYVSPQQEKYRYQIFAAKLKMINKFNGQNYSYKKGINQFSDWTQKQFVGNFYVYTDLMLMRDLQLPVSTNPTVLSPTFVSKVADWTSSGKVGIVKDQGKACRSGWAFATVGTIQSNLAIKLSVPPKPLSEQQLIDCCGVRGFMCDGCGGRTWPRMAYNYIASAGLASEQSYPSVSPSKNCLDKVIQPLKYLLPTFSHIQINGRAEIVKYLQKGTLTVMVDSTLWDSYASGFFEDCGQKLTYNHAVVLVGVDNFGNWKIKNSWGVTWGELGYMWIRGERDCGVTQYAMAPNLV